MAQNRYVIALTGQAFGQETVEAEGYDVKSGALVFFNEQPVAGRPRVKRKVTVRAYGPSAWATLTEDGPSLSPGSVPVETMNEVYDALSRSMRFLSTFASVNRGILHDDIQAEARALKIKISDVAKKVAAFCDDEDEEDDDDD